MSASLATSLAANIDFGIFLLIAGFGFVFGFFTVRGSGINNHPWGGHTSSPGAKLPDEFHQFADRQVRAADTRAAAADWRLAPIEPATVPMPQDDMTLADVNRRLAAEAAARKTLTGQDADVEQGAPR